MKKLNFLLIVVIGFTLVTCGGSESEADITNDDTEIVDSTSCDIDCTKSCCKNKCNKENCKKKCCKKKCSKKCCSKNCKKKCCNKKNASDSTDTGTKEMCDEGSCSSGACGGGE